MDQVRPLIAEWRYDHACQIGRPILNGHHQVAASRRPRTEASAWRSDNAREGLTTDGPLQKGDYLKFECRAVRRFAAREVEDERDAAGITETMNFTGEPAPRAAKSLFASPPFAPAAETWPRTVVESMLWRELSAIAWASVEATASQTPASLQRRKR